jgi:hypothetical protein
LVEAETAKPPAEIHGRAPHGLAVYSLSLGDVSSIPDQHGLADRPPFTVIRAIRLVVANVRSDQPKSRREHSQLMIAALWQCHAVQGSFDLPK